jgi:hypothetical protein
MGYDPCPSILLDVSAIKHHPDITCDDPSPQGQLALGTRRGEVRIEGKGVSFSHALGLGQTERVEEVPGKGEKQPIRDETLTTAGSPMLSASIDSPQSFGHYMVLRILGGYDPPN